MLTQEDIERMTDGFEYYTPLPQGQSKPDLLGFYAKWLEGLVLTSGNDRLMENTLGLVGEAGEVAEKVKKIVRDGTLDKDAIKKELGDVYFYLVALTNYFGFTPTAILEENMEKLNSRLARGKLRGSGDDR